MRIEHILYMFCDCFTVSVEHVGSVGVECMMISDRYMVNEGWMVSVRYIVSVVEYMVRAG